jgi:hypothetical protein
MLAIVALTMTGCTKSIFSTPPPDSVVPIVYPDFLSAGGYPFDENAVKMMMCYWYLMQDTSLAPDKMKFINDAKRAQYPQYNPKHWILLEKKITENFNQLSNFNADGIEKLMLESCGDY